MPLWIFFALGTAFAWSAYGIISRVLARDSTSPLALAVPYGVFASVFCFIPALWEPWSFSDITAAVLFATFLATVFFGMYDVFQFFGRKHLEASQSTMLFQLAPIVTFLVAAVFLGEPFTLLKASAIGLVVLGNIVALYRRSGSVSLRGVGYMLLTAFGLGCAYVADKFALPHYPLPLYAFITYLVPTIYCFFVLLARREVAVIKEETTRGSWRIPILAILGVLGYYFALKTFLLVDVSKAIPVMYSSTILTALLGIVILKERGNVVQKLAGAVITVLGVVLLQTS